jgi:hypothetical protein
LYDGHRSHISVTVIEWAQAHNIVIFVLPPHTSHVTQPLDVAVFGPFRKFYNQSVQRFKRQHPLVSITKLNITPLICQSYIKAFTPSNLISAFSKTGIRPFNPQAIPTEATIPSEIHSTPLLDVDTFLNSRSVKTAAQRDQATQPPKRTRNILKVGGKAITEGDGLDMVMEHDKKRKGESSNNVKKGKQRATKKPKPAIDYLSVCCLCERAEPDMEQGPSVI